LDAAPVPTGEPARAPFVESRPRAPSVSPGLLGWPVAFDTPAVLSGTPGVADMSRTVAGAAAPVSAVPCARLSPQPVTKIPAASSSPHVQFTNAQLDSRIFACATLLSLIDACKKVFTFPPSMHQIL